MSGATLKEIQELAGHKTIQMSGRYAHLYPAHELAAFKRIAKPDAAKLPTAIAGPNSHQNSHRRKQISGEGGEKADANT
jgi:hypothetical protein